MRRYWLSVSIFALMWIVLAFGLKGITLDVGELPVDYRTYAAAVDLLKATGSPYPGSDGAQSTWQAMHESAVAAFRPDERFVGNAEVVSGPYLYPPSLALALSQSNVSASLYLVILTIATIGLGIGWLKLSGAQSSAWLFAMAASIDLIAIFLGGNIEIVLIALSLGACWLIWRHQFFWAAPVIAAVILVKPQFLLLFLAFGAMWAFSTSSLRPRFLKTLSIFALVGVLIVLEALRWPETARADFLAYLSSPSQLQYFALDETAQWPMNIWNRAPLQVFLHLGLSIEAAQAVTISLYLLFLVATVILLRHARVGFAVAFSLAYVLLLIGRPITWSMPMLAIFTLTAVWPHLSRRKRFALASVAFAVGATHWGAFALFVSGIWPGLLTLQFPNFPWETVIVLPLAWAVVVLSVRNRVASGAETANEPQ